MEPDFYQYYNTSKHFQQSGGPLSGDYMRALLDSYVGAIKKSLPNARIIWDVSTWPTKQQMITWWGFFKNATYIDYIGTNGAQVKKKELLH
jgi:hypothetical protein